MRRLLDRLLRRRSQAVLDVDVAQADWAPVPPSQLARMDWGQWLQEQPAVPAFVAAAPPKPPLEAAPELSPPSPSPHSPSPSPRARVRTLPGERRWRDVLVELAEHLTDEELLIIKRQMTG